MNIDTIKTHLRRRTTSGWTKKGEQLCYDNGEYSFLFDKINKNFLGFIKLRLVSNGRLIKLSLSNKLLLLPLVLEKEKELINWKKDKAIVDFTQERTRLRQVAQQEEHIKSKPKPTQTPSNSIGELDLSHLRGLLTAAPMTFSGINLRTNDIIEQLIKPKDIEASTKLVKSTIKVAEFKDKVEIERVRIRRILQRNKNKDSSSSGDSGPR